MIKRSLVHFLTQDFHLMLLKTFESFENQYVSLSLLKLLSVKSVQHWHRKRRGSRCMVFQRFSMDLLWLFQSLINWFRFKFRVFIVMFISVVSTSEFKSKRCFLICTAHCQYFFGFVLGFYVL